MNGDDDSTEHIKRPDFEPTDTEKTLLRQVADPGLARILEILMKMEKQNVLGVKAYYLARKHEKMLSPIVQIGIWMSSGVGFIVLVLEVVKFFVKK